MSRIEVLCVTMNQTDLSLTEKMNLKCDAVIANQTTRCDEIRQTAGNNTYRLISTQTKGVGRNRNIAFVHANAEILLLADDDMQYYDGYVEKIEKEFDSHPDADVMIFNIDTTDVHRPQKKNQVTKRIGRLSRLPYGAPRIALRKSSWEKSNVWFTVLFGGGAKYTNGEDSIFLYELRKKGLRIYVSQETIGNIDMSQSSWFVGANEEFYYNKGAFSEVVHPRTAILWGVYYALRVKSDLSFAQKYRAFRAGIKGYREETAFRKELS